MTQAHGSITLHVVSLQLGRRRRRHASIIHQAAEQANTFVQKASQTLGPFVRLNISGPHLTYGSVTFAITRAVIDGEGKAVFEPYEASITAHGRTEPCIVTGPLNDRGKYPTLITSGVQVECYADPEDLGPPIELQRQKI